MKPPQINEVLNETSQSFVPLLADDGSHRLVCPVCSFTYNHVQKVGTELDPDQDQTCIYPGTSIIFERTTGERRSAVRIDIDGECGHNWSLILQQHKGEIFVHVRERKHSPERPPLPGCALPSEPEKRTQRFSV